MEKNPSHLPYIEELSFSGSGDFEDYYPESARGELEEHSSDTRYYGRNVIWLGTEDQMIRVDPNYIQHISGNIFDEDKLAAIVEGIDNAEDRVVFHAPYGEATVIEPQDVKDSIEYAEDDGLDEPYSTGSEELDRYLVDPEYEIEQRAEYEDISEEEAKQLFEEELQEAVDEESGDLGKIAFTIRDGNHRAFGALIAGEPYVYAILSTNQYTDVMDRDSPQNLQIREALI